MKPMSLNLSKVKKIATDGKTSTFQHPDGHQIKIFHGALPAIQKKQIEKMPVHLYQGGDPLAAVENSGSINPDQVDNSPMAVQSPGNVPAPQGMVPQDQVKAPVVPEAKAPADPNDINNLSLGDIYKGQLKAGQDLGAAQGGAANAQAGVEKQFQTDTQAQAAKWQERSDTMQGDIAAALKDIGNGHINPNHYQESQETPQRVANAIGLFLGGLSTPFTHQGNPAEKFIDSQINRDIDAQKAGVNNKMNIYHAYLDKYKDASVAENMARATQMGIYASKIREAAAKSGAPLAIAQAEAYTNNVKEKMLPLLQNANLLTEVHNFTSPGGNGSEEQFQNTLNAAQSINPAIHKDLQEKYLPGVGVTKVPVKEDDAKAFASFKNLNEMAKQAQDFAQQVGTTAPGSANNQRAMDLANNLQLELGTLKGLKRINEFEANKYQELVRNPGQWNTRQAIQSYKDLRSDIAGKAQAEGDRLGIKPFRK